MTTSLFNTIILAVAFLLLFASAELLYHRFKLEAELTRKYVHLCTGLLTMLFPPMIANHWYVLALCASFLLLLTASMLFEQLPSINAVDRLTRGSLLYPVIVYGCYLAFDHYGEFRFYYLPILVLAICDPLAGLTGTRWPIGVYKSFGMKKSLTGSSAFFVSAFATCFGLMLFFENTSQYEAFVLAVTIAAVTTVAEAVSHRGYDNLTIPASALTALVFLQETLVK